MEISSNERRQGMREMQTDIALIKQKAQFIEEKIESIFIDMRKVKEDLGKADILKKNDLDSHATQDRWLFGFVMTLLGAILWFVIKK